MWCRIRHARDGTVMDLFLAQFAATLPADSHAVLVLDGAGWHDQRALTVPDNLTLVSLPAYSPELNPVERIWLWNRAEFINGRGEIVSFLTRKWHKELDYRLIKELWAFGDNRISVRFAYEWHDDAANWFRSYGNENWEFDAAGVMQRRFACINDLPISEADRKYHWPLGRRPDDHPGLSDLGL